MTSFWNGLLRGAAAGAVGTTVLNAGTQLDMIVRGRPASDAPQQVVSVLADRAGLAVPGGRKEWANRIGGLGPLSGTLTGVAVGGVGGVLRAAGLRLPAAVGGPSLGAAAMAVSDGPAALLGLSDPRRWSRADVLADVVPHLVYGVTTHAAIIGAIPEEQAARRRPPVGTLVRAAALGAASGAPSSVGVAALSLPSARSDGGPRRSRGPVLVGLLAGAELVMDKVPVTPARTAVQGLVPRVALGATAGAGLARRNGHDGTLAGAVGMASAVVTTLVGVRARAAAARRLGWDGPGAVAEDALALLLAWYATRR